MPSCKCKVGSCDCGSPCKRCGCACDGVDPERALSRKRGRPAVGMQRPRTRYVSGNPVGRPRLARKPIEKAENLRQYSTAVGLPPSSIRILRPEKHRVNGTVDTSSEAFTRMIRVLRNSSRIAASHVYPALPDVLLQAAARAELQISAGEKEFSKFGDELCEVYKKLRKNSDGKRILRAVAVKGLTKLRRTKWEQKHAIHLSEHVGYADSTQLHAEHGLLRGKRNNVRFNSDVVTHAVKFILAPEHVSTLSWGQRAVRVGDTDYTLPSLHRRISVVTAALWMLKFPFLRTLIKSHQFVRSLFCNTCDGLRMTINNNCK